ncbi:WAT1-related protein At1g09380-like [Bidens hawaiensis]|uniref:WAT1-related protein At1g09380-like n=1 Tax=Bidens hawaiensis TaxID=980011 RepID=UPI004049EC28
MLLTFYKGSLINIRSSHFKLFDNAPSGSKASPPQPIVGTILAVLYSLSIAIHYIIQSKLSANYPCHHSNTLLFSVISFTQSMVAAVISDRSWSKWKLNSKFKLLTAIMQGMCSMIAILLMTAVHRQGPLFASSFNPLVLVFATIAGVIALDERLYVGSLLGSVVFIVGLYGVLWAKGKEKERERERERE